MQELGRQSRTIEDSSASESSLEEISPDEILASRTIENWLENAECERNGLATHCQSLNITDSRKPFIRGMSPTLTLKFWQPIAVAFILEKEKSFMKGCLISDQVGFGKTLELLAALLVVSFPITIVTTFFLSLLKKKKFWFILLTL